MNRSEKGVSRIVEQQTAPDQTQQPLLPSVTPAGWLGQLIWLAGRREFDWALGLTGLGVWLSWLAFPSRLPALGLGALLAGGVGLRWYNRQIRAAVRPRLKLEWLGLAFILALAAALRLVGLAQSLPYFDNPDEPTLTNAAIKMLQTGDLNPHFFRWPSLPFYLQFVVSIPQFLAGVNAGRFPNLNAISPEGFFLAGRTVSASFGVATVLVTYLLGKRFYGPGVGLLAGLILAVLPLHSEHSHYVTPDIEVTFFASLTLLFAAYIYTTGQKRWYLWSGVAAGLTIGSKYNVAIVLLVVMLAHFLTPALRRGKASWLVTTFAVAGITFLLTTPFAVFDLLGFLNELAFQVRHYTVTGHGSASVSPSWSAYLQDFWEQGFVNQASLVALAGIGYGLWRQRREDWLMVVFPVAGYFFFSAAKVHFARNLLPLLPPLAVLSAVVLVAAAGWLAVRLKKTGWQPALTLLLCLVAFSICLQNTVLTDRYYLQPDTRQQAAQWIMTNLPAGSRLRLEPASPILPADRFKNANEQRPIGAHNADWYRQKGFDFLVASSTTYEELSANDPEAAANYRQVFEQFKLKQEFTQDVRNRPGPTIRIYQVK